MKWIAETLSGVVVGVIAIAVVLIAAWLFVVFMRGMFHIITAYNLYAANL